METLVRRLGRIFSLKNKTDMTVVHPVHQLTAHTRMRMERLERALAAYQANQGWRQPVRTVGEAAERLGTDTGILHLYFQDRIGMDFRTWRTRLRLEDAKQMLVEHPELQASDISRRVGFSNRSNFARQFLAYTGSTPAEWRKKAGITHDTPAPENDYV